MNAFHDTSGERNECDEHAIMNLNCIFKRFLNCFVKIYFFFPINSSEDKQSQNKAKNKQSKNQRELFANVLSVYFMRVWPHCFFLSKCQTGVVKVSYLILL